MRILLILLTALITVIQINAQQFNGGASAGIVASEVDGDRLGGLKKIGLFVNVYTSVQFTPKSSVQFEISYIQKGSQSNADYSKNDYESIHQDAL